MRYIRSVLALSLLVIGASAGFAQQTLATITGQVVDASKAAVPGTTVRVRNLDTNIMKDVTTDNSGYYSVSYLIPGHYEVSAEKEGFRRFLAQNFQVGAAQTVRIDCVLEVGSTTSEVTVQDAAPAISTESSNLSASRSNRQLEDLPVNTRGSWDSFIFTYAGMMPGAQPGAAGYDISFNGLRSYQNQFTVDGIATTSTLFGDILGPANPSMDAVEELKVDASVNNAEFQAPTSISVISKSGSNDLHGTLYEFYNSSGFNARDPFSTTVNPRAVVHDFGGSLGGPIKHNKTFFFGSVERFSDHYSALINRLLPTAAMRQGNFSNLGTSIRNPFTGQLFSNGVIPANLLNPTSVALQNRFFPATNYPDANFVGGPNLSTTFPVDQEKTTYDARIDHQLTSNNQLYGRVDLNRLPNHSLEGGLPTIGRRVQMRTAENGVISDTNTFSPTLVNEFRAGITRAHNFYQGPLNGPDFVSQFGLQGLDSSLPSINALTNISIGGGFAGINEINYNDNVEQIYQFQDNATWVRGAHTVKFGGEALRELAVHYPLSPSALFGSASFSGSFTGSPYADFLLGLPHSASVAAAGTNRTYSHNTDFGLFIQDSWKATPRLTLNYGVRWDINPPYVEESGRSYNFDPALGGIVIPSEKSRSQLYSGFVQAGLVPVVTASNAHYPTALVRTDWNNFAPRFGFAYKVTSKDVLRGGYGIFYERETEATWSALRGGNPYVGSTTAVNGLVNGQPLWQLPFVFPQTGSTASTGGSFSGVNPNLRTPYVQQANITWEHQFSPSTGLRISGVNTHGTKLIWVRDLNQLRPGSIALGNAGRMFPNLGSVTYEDNGANSIYYGLNVTLTRSWTNGLQYESTYTWAHNITDNDNDWQGGGLASDAYNREYDRGNVSFTARHRLVNSFMWALPVGHGRRFMSGKSGVLDAILGGWQLSGINIVQSGQYFTPLVDYSVYGVDLGFTNGNTVGRPDAVANGNLPRGQRSITRWFNTGLNTASLPGGSAVPGAAFALAPLQADGTTVARLGNAGSNTLVGPGTFNLNAGLFKSFRLKERLTLQAQITATNVLNHVNPDFLAPVGLAGGAGPDNLLTDSTAGVISGVQSYEGAGARTVRLGVRLIW